MTSECTLNKDHLARQQREALVKFVTDSFYAHALASLSANERQGNEISRMTRLLANCDIYEYLTKRMQISPGEIPRTALDQIRPVDLFSCLDDLAKRFPRGDPREFQGVSTSHDIAAWLISALRNDEIPGILARFTRDQIPASA